MILLEPREKKVKRGEERSVRRTGVRMIAKRGGFADSDPRSRRVRADVGGGREGGRDPIEIFGGKYWEGGELIDLDPPRS